VVKQREHTSPGVAGGCGRTAARLREKPIAAIAKDLGISESCLRNWISQDDVDQGRKEGLTGDERAELVRLRRENRVQAMEIEMFKRASTYFARENVLPKG
jgi:transposase